MYRVAEYANGLFEVVNDVTGFRLRGLDSKSAWGIAIELINSERRFRVL